MPFRHSSAKSTVSRLNEPPAERKAREEKLAAAVRVLLEGIGEDPGREGLLKTPERYAQALLWMTKGYEERLSGQLTCSLNLSYRPMLILVLAFYLSILTFLLGLRGMLVFPWCSHVSTSTLIIASMAFLLDSLLVRLVVAHSQPTTPFELSFRMSAPNRSGTRATTIQPTITRI